MMEESTSAQAPNSNNTNKSEASSTAPTNANADDGNSTTKEDWEVQRDHHKQTADNAFRCGGFRTAIDEYTKAIELDPQFWVALSNRSAAYLKNSEKSKSLKDAQLLVESQPTFLKGHSRLAAALHALKRYDAALSAYQKVLESDSKNAVAIKGAEDCQLELQRMQQAREEANSAAAEKEESADNGNAKEGATKEGEDDGEGTNDDEDDDLLGDFFADVEESTKKVEPVPDEKPKATNKVKHDKEALGTPAMQMDRLLKPNFEWRNLNPFSVLQLPHDATEDDISRRYKALSLMLHPDKNGGSERAQQAFDQVKKAKTLLSDPDRAKHTRMLMEEGMKQARTAFKKQQQQQQQQQQRQQQQQQQQQQRQQQQTNQKAATLKELQDREIMRIFAQVEEQRRQVEDRERKFHQREQQQEDDQLQKERNERKFDKSWRQEDRVGKRVGNWRDFAKAKKSK